MHARVHTVLVVWWHLCVVSSVKSLTTCPSCLECMPLPLLASNSPRVCLMTVCVHACVSKYSLYISSLSTPVGLSVICPPIHSATFTVSHSGWACLLYVLNVSLLDSQNCSVFFTSAVKSTSTSTLPAALSLPVSGCLSLSLYTFYGYKSPCLALHVWSCIPEPMSIDQFDTQCLKMLGVVGTFLNRVQWWSQQYQKTAEVN